MGDDRDELSARELIVEQYVKFQADVLDIASAWAFVMEHIDQVGPDPQISIKPMLVYQASLSNESSYRREFRCVVKGRIDDQS